MRNERAPSKSLQEEGKKCLRSVTNYIVMHPPKPIEAGELVVVIASLAGRLGKDMTHSIRLRKKDVLDFELLEDSDHLS
jgi:hypothetical protein